MLLSTKNVSNVPSVDFTSVINSSYKNYAIIFDSVVSIGSSVNAYLTVQLSDDNGSTYQVLNYSNYLGGGVTVGLTCGLLYDGGGSTAYTVSGNADLHNALSGMAFVSQEASATFFDPISSSLGGQDHHGVYSGTPLVVNALRLVSSDGQNVSGNFYLYGY